MNWTLLVLVKNLNTKSVSSHKNNFSLKYKFFLGCNSLVLYSFAQQVVYMEYLLGSANKLYFRHPDRLSNGFKKNVKKYLNTYPQSILKTLGQKDDTFIFDAGNGYHRQVGGGSRIMLHLNFVENLAYTNWDNKKKKFSM